MRIHLILLVALALGGCTTFPPAQLANPERQQPIESDARHSKSIFITNVAARLIHKGIGQMSAGWACVNQQELIWADNQGVVNAMREQMASTLAKHGYKVHSSLIQGSAEKDADVLIGVALEDIKANICYSIDGMKGGASLTVTWEVLDRKKKDSFFISGSGVARIDAFSRTGDPDVFVKAVEMATENLLAQPAFYQATRK